MFVRSFVHTSFSLTSDLDTFSNGSPRPGLRNFNLTRNNLFPSGHDYLWSYHPNAHGFKSYLRLNIFRTTIPSFLRTTEKHMCTSSTRCHLLAICIFIRFCIFAHVHIENSLKARHVRLSACLLPLTTGQFWSKFVGLVPYALGTKQFLFYPKYPTPPVYKYYCFLSPQAHEFDCFLLFSFFFCF